MLDHHVRYRCVRCGQLTPFISPTSIPTQLGACTSCNGFACLFPFAQGIPQAYERESMSSGKSPSYADAVAAADRALDAILEPLRRPESTWGFEDRNTAAIAFHYWLTEEHSDVLEVLQDACKFEPMSMETYMELHSVAWEVMYVGIDDPIELPLDPDYHGDRTLIRRRPA
jgi:hypothetical protein